MRLFEAVDDGIRIAATGVQWDLKGTLYTIVSVVCLGYTTPASSRKRRSAKLDETRPINIILRDATIMGDVTLEQLCRIPAVKLFHVGEPTETVDIIQVKQIKQQVADFIAHCEKCEQSDKWNDIPYLFPPKAARKIQEPPEDYVAKHEAARQRDIRKKKKSPG